MSATAVAGTSARRAQGPKVSCETCFFGANLLCALSLGRPCPTYRPNHPEGLRPPRQTQLVFREERRRQAVFAFPSAEEQARRHA